MPMVIAVLTLFAALNMRTYRIVTGTLFVALLMGEVSAATEPAEITLHIRGEYKGVVSALLAAVDEGTPVTGIAELDSLAAIYGLMGIYRKGKISPFYYGYRFRLTFPPGADVAAIAGAYWNVSYIKSVEPEPPPQARVQKIETHPPFDIDGKKRRIFEKAGAGIITSAASTAAFIGVIAWASSLEAESHSTESDDGIGVGAGILLFSLFSHTFGTPIGVTLVDPYDDPNATLRWAQIGGLGGLGVGVAVARIPEPLGQIGGFAALYLGPIIGSIYGSEKSRKPPQDRWISFGLAPTLNGGLSAVAQLRF